MTNAFIDRNDVLAQIKQSGGAGSAPSTPDTTKPLFQNLTHTTRRRRNPDLFTQSRW